MDLIPGFLQGVTRVIISYPFDYIRTNLQAQHNTSIFSYVSNHKLSIRDAYRGCTLPLLTVPIDRSIQFLLFERFSKEHSIITSSTASSLISSTYSVPVNFLSTYIITQHANLTLDNIRSFIKKSNYYTGFSADFTKSFLGAVLYTSIYGQLRKSIDKEKHNYFLFGIASSLGSWSFIYPFDTMRVMKQTSTKTYMDIIKTTSIRNLYKGFSIILVRSIPSAGCGMFVYERSKQFLLPFQ
jgi:hypothetical protein